MTEETQPLRWGVRAPGWAEVRHIPQGRTEALDQAIGIAELEQIPVTVYLDNGSGWSPMSTFKPGSR